MALAEPRDFTIDDTPLTKQVTTARRGRLLSALRIRRFSSSNLYHGKVTVATGLGLVMFGKLLTYLGKYTLVSGYVSG
jgi:hypothetical protein